MIETDRLRLRPWREADKPHFERIANTPAMMAHMGGVGPRAQFDALVDAQIAMQLEHGFSFWAVEMIADGTLVGMCGPRIGGHPGTPVENELEIGWRIAEPFWGRGFAKEAASASIAFAFAQTGRPRILAWTIPANRASWGLMIALGMTRRQALDFDHPRFPNGHPVRQHIVYGLDRP